MYNYRLGLPPLTKEPKLEKRTIEKIMDPVTKGPNASPGKPVVLGPAWDPQNYRNIAPPPKDKAVLLGGAKATAPLAELPFPIKASEVKYSPPPKPKPATISFDDDDEEEENPKKKKRLPPREILSYRYTGKPGADIPRFPQSGFSNPPLLGDHMSPFGPTSFYNNMDNEPVPDTEPLLAAFAALAISSKTKDAPKEEASKEGASKEEKSKDSNPKTKAPPALPIPKEQAQKENKLTEEATVKPGSNRASAIVIPKEQEDPKTEDATSKPESHPPLPIDKPKEKD